MIIFIRRLTDKVKYRDFVSRLADEINDTTWMKEEPYVC